MASAQAPVNGTYAQQSTIPPTASPAPTHSSQSAIVSKDEIAWYFVERYYNTLSRNPEKLYLFHGKRSQLVSGVEEEKVEVSVGQVVSLFPTWTLAFSVKLTSNFLGYSKAHY